jgi:hypothetical protein
LGHDQVMTTLSSYGEVQSHRQGEIMRRLGEPIPHAGEDISTMLERAGLKLSRA